MIYRKAVKSAVLSMLSLILLLSLLITSNKVNADGVVVDKVYHPYVLPNEQQHHQH